MVTNMTNYSFTHFMRDLTAYVCIGAVMMLMVFCFLNGGEA